MRKLKFDNFTVELETIDSASNYDLNVRILKGKTLEGGTIMKRNSTDLEVLTFVVEHLNRKLTDL